MIDGMLDILREIKDLLLRYHLIGASFVLAVTVVLFVTGNLRRTYPDWIIYPLFYPDQPLTFIFLGGLDAALFLMTPAAYGQRIRRGLYLRKRHLMITAGFSEGMTIVAAVLLGLAWYGYSQRPYTATYAGQTDGHRYQTVIVTDSRRADVGPVGPAGTDISTLVVTYDCDNLGFACQMLSSQHPNLMEPGMSLSGSTPVLRGDYGVSAPVTPTPGGG